MATSKFCAHEIEYLSYILTREVIKPQTKKVQAILLLNLPNIVKELRHFHGMVQYYWDMWARHSEMLIPLTDLVGECIETKTTKMNKTKKKPWQWDPIHQQAFDYVKAVIEKETVQAHPDFLKPFEIYADASATQLGAVITQDNRPIAFFSRKLSKMQPKTVSQKLNPGHSGNTKGVQRDAVGARHQSLHRSQKSNKRFSMPHLSQSIPLMVTQEGICPQNNTH